MGVTGLLFKGQRELRAGEAAKALDTLRAAAGREPGSPHVALHHALALADAGRLDDALAALALAEAHWPENPVFPLFRGAVLGEAGLWDAAAPALQAAQRLSPGNLLAEAYLALAAMRRGEFDRPLRRLAAVGMTDSPRALAAILAEVEAELFRRFGPHTDGKPPKAPEGEADGRIRRLSATRLLAMGRARLESGDAAAAWRLLGLAAEKNPSLPDVFADLGFAAHDLGRYEEALDHLSRTGSWSKPLDAIHLHRGACLYKLGRYPEALESLQAAEAADSLGDYSAWIQLYFARVLIALGRVAEARPHLRRLLEAEGDMALARLRHARELLGLAVPESAPDGYDVIADGKTILVVKPAYADAVRELRLPSAGGRQPTADCRLLTADCRLPTAVCRPPSASRLPPLPDGLPPPADGLRPPVPAGRAPMQRIALPDGGTALVRQCRRGGLFARLLGDKHFDGNRFLREIAVSDALRRRGIPTPEIIAGIRRETFPGVYCAEIIVREIPDSLDLAAALRSLSPCGTAALGCDADSSLPTADCRLPSALAVEDRKRGLLAASARLLRQVHDAGLFHPDLNARNILIAADGTALILDLDRAELLDELPLSGRFAALARLYRSLHKLGLAPDPVSDADWAIFYDAYAGDDPLLLGHTDAFLARCHRHLRRHRLWWQLLGKALGTQGMGGDGKAIHKG